MVRLNRAAMARLWHRYDEAEKEKDFYRPLCSKRLNSTEPNALGEGEGGWRREGISGGVKRAGEEYEKEVLRGGASENEGKRVGGDRFPTGDLAMGKRKKRNIGGGTSKGDGCL